MNKRISRVILKCGVGKRKSVGPITQKSLGQNQPPQKNEYIQQLQTFTY